ncbi:MAG: hypothetical protein ACJ8CB_32965 [Ktedonobacteraceae bacterium]
MGDMVDRAGLSEYQRVEFHEGGRVWIVEGGRGACARTIKLSAAAALRLFDALLLYEDELAKEARLVLRDESVSKHRSE